MSSDRELFAKLAEWEAGFPSPPSLFDAIRANDVELLAAFVLRGFREAAKKAVGDRLALEQKKLVGMDLRYGSAGRVADFLARAWSIGDADQLRLLDLIDPASLVELRVMLPEDLHNGVLERLPMLLEIYHALHTLFPESGTADTWLNHANGGALFGGHSPLQIMLERGLAGIRDVRGHLWVKVRSLQPGLAPDAAA